MVNQHLGDQQPAHRQQQSGNKRFHDHIRSFNAPLPVADFDQSTIITNAALGEQLSAVSRNTFQAAFEAVAESIQ
jgi:hypothetical protein